MLSVVWASPVGDGPGSGRVFRVARVVAALTCGLAAAAPSWAASLVGTTTTPDALYSASRFYVHCANGYYWVAYHDGVKPVLASSRDAVSWTSQGAIFSSFNPNSGEEWAVRFSGNNIVAFAFNGATNNRYYRNAVLNSTGTVTWNAADAAAGPVDSGWAGLNALIANGKPIRYRSVLGEAGDARVGSQLNSPTWTGTGAAPLLTPTTGGNFNVGALYPTGGARADDFIVLRATTTPFYSLGSHRLVSVKWNSGATSWDAGWYNVSTLGGGLPESATTEVKDTDDASAHRMFAAVRDTSGNTHAVYVNRNNDVVHYKKAVGFNDSWSRISTDVTQSAAAIDRVALTAVGSNNLYLFYSKSDGGIYYRRFDGTTWGAESVLKSAGTALQGALAPMESASGCSVGLAWVEGSGSPYNVMFSLGIGSCGELSTIQGAGTVTVTAPASFEMTFDTNAAGGAIAKFYDLAEDSARTNDLAGSLETSNGPRGLHNFGMAVGGTSYNASNNVAGARLDLLEATPTRMRVRQESFYQSGVAGPILTGVKGIGDYSVYPEGRTALRWERRTTSAVTYTAEYSELVVHRLAVAPLNGWATYRELGTIPPAGTGNDAFLMAQNELAGGRTDFLQILNRDWTVANGYPGTADLTDATTNAASERINMYWDELTGAALAAGASHVWNSLTYFKPTNFVNQTDAAVTTRSADYRTPATLTVAVGSGWFDPSENTSAVGPDFFNESEAAYTLDLNPSSGLTFDINGTAANPRYHPFFKIRQWRSLGAPPSVTLEGTALVRGVDYKADVKPVSRAHFAQDILWHSTLENAAAVTNPDVGTGDFTTGAVAYVPARYGNGLQVSGDNQFLTHALSDDEFNKVNGAVEFWFQPAYSSTDAIQHDIAGFFNGASDAWVLRKGADNNLYFTITAGGAVSQLTVTSANYSWRTSDWVHLRMEWDGNAPLATQQRLYINGVEPPHTDPAVDYNPNALLTNSEFNFGKQGLGRPSFSPGIYDEIYCYGPHPNPTIGSPATPTLLAYGGLTTNSSEYLADGSRNFTLSFAGVAPGGQGEYLHLGSDSQFRGLNVALATSGAGVAAGALEWEYWNGTAWVNLETVPGFTDQTNSFTKGNGSVFWTADPSGWSPYSVNGGPDLYYMRVHLVNGATYSTFPVEAGIKTDILLFQYCGDITAPAQTFSFAAPVPTAVTLQSFEARGMDSAVALTWQTGSELNNLGFHLYRSLSAAGPYQRITSSVIPGLGSSPVGASYSYLDSGLLNGTTYYYKLEDIETTGKTTLHGPVSAAPQASGTGGGSSGNGSGSGTGSGSGSSSGSGGSSGNDTSSSLARITYGDPSAVSLHVLEQDQHHLLLELSTPGFFATPNADGSVQLEVPGFVNEAPPGAPALPTLRTWVEAVAGRSLRLDSVRVSDVVGFSSLRPTAAGLPEMGVGQDGTIRARFRSRKPGRAFRRAGLVPTEPAQVLETGFQAETKKAEIEIAPLRWDPSSQRLLLARRMLLRIVFAGVELEELSMGGSRGHKRPQRPSFASSGVLAWLTAHDAELYAVRFEDVFPSQRKAIASSQLRLSYQGQPVGFHIEPNTSSFGPGSLLYFLSQGASLDPYGDAVYALEKATGGVQMPAESAGPSGSLAAYSFQHGAWEVNRLYQGGLLEASDLWMWDGFITGLTKTFTIDHLASSQEPARLSVFLQGASDFEANPDHHVRASLNGVAVGEVTWDGKTPMTLLADVSPGILLEGDNTLALENVPDIQAAYSLVYLDRFTLDYPRQTLTSSGRFEGRFSFGGQAQVQGLDASTRLVDTTAEPARWLTGALSSASGLSFRTEAGRSYLAVSDAALLHPQVRLPLSNSLKSTRNQADYILIGPRDFLPAAQSLLDLRRDQGLHVMAVAVEDVFDSFGFGEPRPEAIKDFIAFAFHNWQAPALHYVLLLGDATYDPKSFMGTGVVNRVPPLMVKTSFMWTVSDPTLAAVNGNDALPDLAIGRLPASSLDEATVMVDKTVAFEKAGFSLLGGPDVIVADNPDAAGDFEKDAQDIATTFFSGKPLEEIFLSQQGAATRSAIMAAFNGGASLVSYIGHGSTAVWASENVFNSWDVQNLLPQPQQPFLMTLNCLNGYFLPPQFSSFAEAMLKADGKGAIASFSPSSLSLNDAAHLYHKALLSEILSGRHDRMGDAVLAAQATYAQTGAFPEALAIYHLVGDPALRIR